jgi:hypothetical protein
MKPRELKDEEALRDFLTRDVEADSAIATQAIAQLQQQTTSMLPNVVLSVARQRQLGLL